MLAAKRSFGSLRAAARAQQCAPASQAVPSSQRSFMSAVLLSRDQFNSKTVVDLKKQLSERGLSTRGKKKELVDRLVESVSKGTFGPNASASTSSINTTSTTTTTSKVSPSQQTSSFSTTARASASATTTGSGAANAETATGTVVESAEVPIHAPAAEAAAQATPITPPPSDEVTAGPGLIVNKEEAAQVAEKAEEVPGGTIEMPNAVFLPSVDRDILESQHEMMIPEMPHNYKNPANHDPYTQPFTLHPSWLKVDNATSSVHHAGGSGMVTEDPDSRSSEPRKQFEYSDSNTLLQDMLTDLGIRSKIPSPKRLKEVEKELKKQSSAILSLLEETSGVKIPPLSQAPEHKAPEFEFQDRPLNSQETTGLWTLAGIIGGVLVLGSLGSKEKKTDHKKEEESKDH